MQLFYIYTQFRWASVEKGSYYFFTTQILPSQKQKTNKYVLEGSGQIRPKPNFLA